MTRVNFNCLTGAGAACVGAMLVAASSATAQISIDPAMNVPAGVEPSGVAAGDFNGDGFMDLATTVDNPDRLAILLGSQSGTYTAGPGVFLPNSSSPQDVIAGDFDGNGSMDLAVAVRDPVGSVLLYVNNGAGGFTQGANVAVGERPRGFSAADIDGNGTLDLAVANRDDGSASVIVNNGGLSFTVMTMAVGEETRHTALADFNGDGQLDLAVTDHGNRNVQVFLRSGATFVAGQTLPVGGQVRPEGVAAADVTDDGLMDILTATSSMTPLINQVSVFVNTGAGFSGPFNYPTGGMDSGDLAVADLDCDGALDVVTANQDSNNISVLRNNGDGSFGAAITPATGAGPSEITVADLDGDGDADIATANDGADTLSVFINQTCEVDPGTPGDFNDDGVVNVSDLLILLGDWGACPDCPTDLTGDGMVNVLDLLQLFSLWS